MSTSVFLWQAFVTLLIIIDPFVVVPAFVNLTRYDEPSVQRKVAKRACVISIILLICFAFIGDKLLDAMNISEPAFRIAGGLLFLLAAIEMVIGGNMASRKPTDSEVKEASQREDISVFPLAIPLIAGPGALTSIVVLMRQAEQMGWEIQLSIIAVTCVVMIITYLCLLTAQPIMRLLGVTGTNVLTRVFGIILSAVGIQSIINGIIIIFKQYI
jgi:multiple antibiotic resistance protein